MSELINSQIGKKTLRSDLLATVSAFVLGSSMLFAQPAKAGDDDKPTVWIELGGQAEFVNGMSEPFEPPFVFGPANPGVYDPVSPVRVQKEPKFSFGEEGSIAFEPKHSDWVFSAGVRYGRSVANRYVHQQTAGQPIPSSVSSLYGISFPYATGNLAYAEFKGRQTESHLVLDFQAGKDVGLGMFGKDSTSVISAGVRLAQFNSSAQIRIRARPDLVDSNITSILKYDRDFHHYYLSASNQHSFHGIGPSVSWKGSASLFRDSDDSGLAFDWGINAAVLFGRQKTKSHHHTSGYHNVPAKYGSTKEDVYDISPPTQYRSRSVAVTNIGGNAGVSYRFYNAKLNFGYRADMFFNAIDTGVDTRKTSNVLFHGPYASISIGLGG